MDGISVEMVVNAANELLKIHHEGHEGHGEE